MVGSFEFPVGYRWTPEALIGLVYSTSFLSHAVLGDLTEDFEAELRRALPASDPTGPLAQTIRFAYELARRPTCRTQRPVRFPHARATDPTLARAGSAGLRLEAVANPTLP